MDMTKFNKYVIYDDEKAANMLVCNKISSIVILDTCSISAQGRIYDKHKVILNGLNRYFRGKRGAYIIFKTVFDELCGGSGLASSSLKYINSIATEEHPVFIVKEEIGITIKINEVIGSSGTINEYYADCFNSVKNYLDKINILLKREISDSDGKFLVKQGCGRPSGKSNQREVILNKKYTGNLHEEVGDFIRKKGKLQKDLGEQMMVLGVCLLEWYIKVMKVHIYFCSEDGGGRSKMMYLVESRLMDYIDCVHILRTFHVIQQVVNYENNVNSEMVVDMFNIASNGNPIAKLTVRQKYDENAVEIITLTSKEPQFIADMVYKKKFVIA